MKKITQKLRWVCLAMLFVSVGKAQMITTVAGNGTGGSTGNGGQATAAELHGPAAVDFDAAGNLYIADQTNNMIRKITSAGVISTLAGTGTAGYSGDGGQATAAKLDAPTGVTLDAYGNVYVADQYTYRIRKISTSGIITTVAGNGSATFAGDGGQATAASLYNPTCVAFDAAGNMYIADYSNNRVRKVNSSGIISTVAGNGTASFSGDGGQATAAEINGAVGVTFDGAGNMFIADRNNNRIRKVTTAGIINTYVGNGTAGATGDGGQATSAELSGPFGIGLDSYENLYIADAGNNKVRRVNSTGVISTIAGTGTAGYSGDGGYATAAELDFPAEISLGIDGNDNLYIADYGNNRVREVTYCTSFYFKTIASGNYSSASIWQASPNNSTNWANVLVAPDYQSAGIVISSGDSVVFNSTDTLDQVTVNGILVYGTGCTLNLNNGTGVDLSIASGAKFYDEGDNSIVWNSATWTLGSTASIIRTRSTSSDNFRTQYDGGISTIPSTSNWIVRKTGTDNPSISTNSMYYGNLNIENNTGTTWTTSTASSFTGTAGYPTIQGNMSIGGNGTGNVSFLDTNTNAQAMIVQGNFTVTTGSTFRNHGTGCQVQGNLVLNGTVNYTSSSMFSFSGSNNQTISGTSITFNNLSLNKSSAAATVTLNAPVSIAGTFTFTNGTMVTDTVHLLTFNAGSSASGVNNDSSFVSGPVKKIGNTDFVFPLGSGNNAQTIEISAPTYTTDAFQAQYFNADPTAVYGSNMASTFNYVSTCQYFTLLRKNGTSNVQLTLSYDLTSCVINLLPNPRVVGFNGTQWQDLGEYNLTYTGYGGTVSTASVVTQYFGPFTLGNNSSDADSLLYTITPPIDYYVQPPNPAYLYYANSGQILTQDTTIADSVKFYSEFTSPKLFFGTRNISFLFGKTQQVNDSTVADSLQRINLTFIGSNSNATINSFDQTTTFFNYISGYAGSDSGYTHIMGNRGLIMRNIYPNIDLQIYSNANGLKYYFVAKPGSKPTSIKHFFKGAKSCSITSGSLTINSAFGSITLNQPVPYQIDSLGNPVLMSWDANWVNTATNQYDFNISTYDQNLPLIFEISQSAGATSSASIPFWSTCIPGVSDNAGRAVSYDEVNNVIYMAGETNANFGGGPTLPFSLTPYGYSHTYNSGTHAYILAFNNDITPGTGNAGSLLWGTYLAGNGSDYIYDIKYSSVDGGRLYVVGESFSTSNGTTPVFPLKTLTGGYNQSNPTGGLTNPIIGTGIIARFHADGVLATLGKPDWITFFGYISSRITGIDEDTTNNIYIVGTQAENPAAQSSCSAVTYEFPTCTPTGAYTQAFGGGNFTSGLWCDGSVSAFNSSGVLQWSSFLGGSNDDFLTDVAVDNTNNFVYVVGNTISTPATSGSGFALAGPTGSYQDNTNASNTLPDCLLAKFGTAGATSPYSLQWLTLFGGQQDDEARTVKVNRSNGDVYVAGITESGGGTIGCSSSGVTTSDYLPTCATGTEFTESYAGDFDYFLTEFNTTNYPVWSTFIGGASDESYSPSAPWAGSPSISIDVTNKNVYLGGTTYYSSSITVPILAATNGLNYNQPTCSQTSLVSTSFLFAVDNTNKQIWGSYFGGTGYDDIMTADVGEMGVGVLAYNNNVFMTGLTHSTSNFPQNGPFSSSYSQPPVGTGVSNAFICEINTSAFTGIQSYNNTNATTGKLSEYTLYPNPTNGGVTIRGAIPDNSVIQVLNNLGQVVYSVQQHSSVMELSLDLSNLTNGMYMVNILNGHSSESKKVIIFK